MNQLRGAPEPITDVAIGIVRKGNAFLVGQRSGTGPLPGYAEFPGGKCLDGETAQACVGRECREETGLRVEVIGVRKEVIHDYPHGKLRITFFDCTTTANAEPKSPFRWVERAELASLQFPEANQSLIAELLAEKQSEPDKWSEPEA